MLKHLVCGIVFLFGVITIAEEEGSPANVGSVGDDLLRVCIAEAGFGNEDDCVGIWHVVNNVAAKRGWEFEEALRKMHPILRTPKRQLNPRLRWIADLDMSCAKPRGIRMPDSRWEENFQRKCLITASIVSDLVAGKIYDPEFEKAIAWGGRCEDDFGACDDHVGCARGLGRIKTKTANAFWSRGGDRRICKQAGD